MLNVRYGESCGSGNWIGGSGGNSQFPPYIVDFTCVQAPLIVEADGGQHALSNRDARRDRMLRAQGWRILRFWNNEILTNRPGVLQTIAEALGTADERHPHPTPPPLAGEGAGPALDDYRPPPPLGGERQGGG